MARTDFPVCDAHLDAPAAWRCERWSRNLCEECGVGVPAGRGEITCCAACGGLVAEIRVPRALARPFPTEIRSAVLQALSPKALGLVAVVTCASQTLAWAGRDGWVLALAVLASLCGALVFTRAEELGHGDPAEYTVPAFPDARPRGSRDPGGDLPHR
jgi:hypothetical protein